MGCNAWNHEPNCNCGWGGDTNSGGQNYSIEKLLNEIVSRPSYFVAPDPTPAKRTQVAGSRYWYGNVQREPNARCPVCKKDVYFVQTEYGGRVYFDELGPPWPKHPCTDSGIQSHRASSVERHNSGTPTEEWFLLQEPKIKRWVNGVYIEGYCSTLRKQLRLHAEGGYISTIIPPIFVKPAEVKGGYQCNFLIEEAIGLPQPSQTKHFIEMDTSEGGLDDSSDWHLLQDPTTWKLVDGLRIEGFCPSLKRYVKLQTPEVHVTTIVPPILVKPEEGSTTYLCRYGILEASRLPEPTLTKRFYSVDASTPRVKEETEWHLLEEPKIWTLVDGLRIDGFCPSLKRQLTLQNPEAHITTIVPPIYVKPDEGSGTYLCRYGT